MALFFFDDGNQAPTAEYTAEGCRSPLVLSAQASLQKPLAQVPCNLGRDWIVGSALIEQGLREGVFRAGIDEHLCANSGCISCL
jgi:hypothetical protein